MIRRSSLAGSLVAFTGLVINEERIHDGVEDESVRLSNHHCHARRHTIMKGKLKAECEKDEVIQEEDGQRLLSACPLPLAACSNKSWMREEQYLNLAIAIEQ